MNEKRNSLENTKNIWFADWSFPIFVGLLSAGVYAGTSMYYNYGVGAFNEVAIVAMLKAGMSGGSYGAAAAFGASFLFARVLEGSLDGILDLGGSILTGVGIGIPAIFLSMGLKKLVNNFIIATFVGLIIGLLIGSIIYFIRHFTLKQSKATFGADVMMGAGNDTGRFLGPLIILSAATASIPIGIGSIVGAAIFYGWKKPIAGGAIIGAMVLGFFFPIKV
ncbi:MAG: DUF4310 family protein [Liquorilactobacillus ghanensis]|uniref:DUF4310 family protein n=1 Tax=Liquorilactobacillus ghanensis TaxID=399370 RepID=UPI0039EB8D29